TVCKVAAESVSQGLQIAGDKKGHLLPDSLRESGFFRRSGTSLHSRTEEACPGEAFSQTSRIRRGTVLAKLSEISAQVMRIAWFTLCGWGLVESATAEITFTAVPPST